MCQWGMDVAMGVTALVLGEADKVKVGVTALVLVEMGMVKMVMEKMEMVKMGMVNVGMVMMEVTVLVLGEMDVTVDVTVPVLSEIGMLRMRNMTVVVLVVDKMKMGLNRGSCCMELLQK